ncbi:amidase [Mesorhizobium sp. M00.F.Ca.ET.170.01.1.1]|nr:amidase [Mesorhizobium sp. M00.F.Ca.ET.170.01.1.1]
MTSIAVQQTGTQPDAQALTAGFESGAVSPVDACAAALDRIERINPSINAFSQVLPGPALSAAEASAKRWKAGKPLSCIDGVPCTVKDLLLSKDWAASFGSHVFDSRAPADFDAPAVARLKEAGAVILGLTTSPEMGWKAVTDSPRFGVTRNPWDTTKTAGGSSGGAAAAAAADLGSLHVGTDGGGSIRIPAAFCGIVGLKPSFGRVPAYPASPCGTVAHTGPMTRTVRDAALMLSILSKSDSRDWHALKPDGLNYHDNLTADLAGKRIAFSANLGHLDVDPEIVAIFRETIDVFRELGAILEEVDPPLGPCQAIFNTLWFAGAAYRMRSVPDEERDRIDPGLREVAVEGARISLHEFQKATLDRSEMGARMRAFHQRYSLLLTPATTVVAFDAGQEVPNPAEGARWTDWAGFSYPFNLTQQPACSVPCGWSSSGLPIGLQIVGPNFADLEVLQAAYSLEQARPGRQTELNAA